MNRFVVGCFMAWMSCTAALSAQENPYYDPTTEDLFEEAATQGADDAGLGDLADAIRNGEVDVFYGFGSPEHPSFSFLWADGHMAILCASTNYWYIIAGAFHEWWHKNNPPPPPPPPTGDKKQDKENKEVWEACKEVGALCASLQGIADAAAASGESPPCSLVEKIMDNVGQEALVCCCGTKAFGPTNDDLCGITIDCEEGK